MSGEIFNPEHALKALADPTRLQIVEFLSACAPESRTASLVCEEVTGRPIVTSTISHHLHELQEAKLITIQKDGKRRNCSLNKATLKALSKFLDSLAESKDYI